MARISGQQRGKRLFFSLMDTRGQVGSGNNLFVIFLGSSSPWTLNIATVKMSIHLLTIIKLTEEAKIK